MKVCPKYVESNDNNIQYHKYIINSEVPSMILKYNI